MFKRERKIGTSMFLNSIEEAVSVGNSEEDFKVNKKKKKKRHSGQSALPNDVSSNIKIIKGLHSD